MKTFIQTGLRINWTNATGGTVLSGAVVVLVAGPNGYAGILVDDTPNGSVGAVEVDRVHQLAALSTDVASQGDVAYWDATNSRVTVTRSGNTRIGRFWIAKANTVTTAQVKLNEEAGTAGLLNVNTAASTAITNTTAETTFSNGTITIPANTLRVGDVFRARVGVSVPAQNSTDTLNVKVKLDTNILAQTGAWDPATADIAWIDVEIVIRTIGAGGTFIAYGMVSGGVPGTVTEKAVTLVSTAIDTTAAHTLTVTGTWSVANAGDQALLDIFDVDLLGR